MPDFSVVLALVGLMLTFLTPAIISRVLGRSSGVAGMLLATAVGSQIAVFISTLMMVGFVTAPMEIKFFNKRETVLRNGLSLVFSFVVAAVMGVVLR